MNVIIEQEKIDQLKEIMEDDFPLLIQSYIQDNSEYLEQLKQNVNVYSEDDIRRAHSIKSTSLNIGATAVADIARELEEQLKGQTPLSDSQWLNMSQIFHQTVETLQEMIS